MYKKIRKLLIIIICLSLLLFSTIFANATPLSSHEYAAQKINGTYTGGYFYMPSVNIWSNWSVYGDPTSFITNEIWVNSSSSSWIETGQVDGCVNGSYWKGRYTAYQNSSGYHEFTSGSSNTTSAAGFEIQYMGNSNWSAIINGSTALTVALPFTSAQNVICGIESNDSGNGFNNASTDTNLEYETGGNTWYLWNTTTVSNYDLNTSWSSKYNSSNNTITFNN